MKRLRPPALRCPAAICVDICLVACLAVAACVPAGADERRDHDRARAALKAGEVQPLQDVLDKVLRSYPGEVLEVELEREDGRWVYELKLLQPGGRLLKLEVDARTAVVLRSRQRPAPSPAASTPPPERRP